MAKYNYQIIITSHGKQIEFIKSFTTEGKANKHFHKMIEENKKIVFPVRYINFRKIMEAKYELVIIKRKEKNEEATTKLRNDYGEFVNYSTNNENWVVYDKAPYDLEESFWVYGYHPLNCRKDFNFIFNELVVPKVTKKYDFLQIISFKNKLILKTYNHTDLVTCKNKSDSIRLYNEIKDRCEKNKKYKYCMFSGDWDSNMRLKREAYEIIKELTNWNKIKIMRSTTRP